MPADLAERASPALLLLLVWGCSRGPAAAPGGAAAHPPAVATREVTYTAPDGWSIYADYLQSPSATRAVVLLHQRGGSAADWQPLMARLKALSVSALAIDQRGAGRSKGKRNGEDAPWDTTLDVAGAVSWLTRQALAPKHVGVAGASYGANNALVYAAASRDVPAVALLSPGTDYHGITIPPALSSFRGRILVLAASGDSSMRGGPEAIRRLSPSAEIETYAGDAHGTNLFWSNPESADAVATFLARSL